MADHDVLSLSMFWAGALMVFTPMLSAAAVLTVWWRQRRKTRDGQTGGQTGDGQTRGMRGAASPADGA